MPIDNNGNVVWGRSFSDREKGKIKLRIHQEGATNRGKMIYLLFEERRKRCRGDVIKRQYTYLG